MKNAMKNGTDPVRPPNAAPEWSHREARILGARTLNGKVAWITGAGTGIGAAAAMSPAEAGNRFRLSERAAD